MIRRVAAVSLVLLALSTLSSLAALKEVRSSADLAVDHKTGLPAVYFTVVLEYDPIPTRADLAISWTVYARVDGREVPGKSEASTAAPDAAAARIWLMSPPMPIEPGKAYGAHLVVEDRANGFTYRKDFQYLAPLVVPLGIRLEGWDGSSAVDLTGVADEELEDLVTLYTHLKTYVQTASDIALETFLSPSMATVQTYPAVVMVVPNAGLSTTYGGNTHGVTLTVGQAFVLYVVPSANELAALRTQVTAFDRPILGDVYLGPGDLGSVTALCVYIDDVAWDVLKAASAEWAKRTA